LKEQAFLTKKLRYYQAEYVLMAISQLTRTCILWQKASPSNNLSVGFPNTFARLFQSAHRDKRFNQARIKQLHEFGS
jgi:hypothetical protein